MDLCALQHEPSLADLVKIEKAHLEDAKTMKGRRGVLYSRKELIAHHNAVLKNPSNDKERTMVLAITTTYPPSKKEVSELNRVSFRTTN